MERIVPIAGVEADLDVVPTAPGGFENAFHVKAKVAFNFQDQPADATIFILGAVAQELFGERIHAAGGLACSNRSHNGNSREKSPVGDHQPARVLNRLRFLRLVDFANHEIQPVPVFSFRVPRQPNQAGFFFP